MDLFVKIIVFFGLQAVMGYAISHYSYSGYMLFILLGLLIVVLLWLNARMSPRWFYTLNPLSMFLLGTASFVVVPSIFTDFPEIRDEGIWKVVFATSLGVLAFTAGWIGGKWKRKFPVIVIAKDKIENIGKVNSIGFGALVFIFICGVCVYYLSMQKTGSDLLDQLTSMRSYVSKGNIWETFYRIPYTFSLGLLNEAALVLVGLVVLDVCRHPAQKTIASVIYAVAVLINLGTGTRMKIFLILIPSLIMLAYISSFKERNIGILKMLSVALVFVFIIGFQTAYRNIGFEPTSVEKVLQDSLDVQQISMYGLNQVPSFLRAMQMFPHERDYLYGSTLFAVLVNPIPREFYPDKPVGIGAVMGNVDLVTRTGVSISITIFGELYANGGYFAIIVGLFVAGFGLRKWHEWYLKNQTKLGPMILYANSLPAIALEVRGGFLEITMLFAVQLLSLLIILKYLNLNALNLPLISGLRHVQSINHP